MQLKVAAVYLRVPWWDCHLRYPGAVLTGIGRQVTDSMPIVASPLAILLSVLMAATSLSASVCDLSCWLHVAHSCLIASSTAAPKVVAVTSTPPATSMTPHHCRSLMGTRTPNTSRNSVRQATGMPLPLEKPSHRTAARMNAGGDPGTFSSCTQEACNQRSAIRFPSRADKSQTVPAHLAEIRIVSSFNPSPTSRSRRLESPPSEVLTVGSPLTTLRI
jgi:hypothetical protein